MSPKRHRRESRAMSRLSRRCVKHRGHAVRLDSPVEPLLNGGDVGGENSFTELRRHSRRAESFLKQSKQRRRFAFGTACGAPCGLTFGKARGAPSSLKFPREISHDPLLSASPQTLS